MSTATQRIKKDRRNNPCHALVRVGPEAQAYDSSLNSITVDNIAVT